MSTEDLINKYFIGELKDKILLIYDNITFEKEEDFRIGPLFLWDLTEYGSLCSQIELIFLDKRIIQQEKYKRIIQLQREAGIKGDEFNEAYEYIEKLENKLEYGKG